jgi:tetratricopeptide (TPR) repeat protein
MAMFKPQPLTRSALRLVAGWQVFFRRFPAAIVSYRHCLAIYPQDEAAQAALAHLFAQTDTPHCDATAALALYAQLHTQHPRNANHRFNAGFLLQSQGLHAQASSAFEDALAVQPALDRAWYGLALSQMALSQWAAAAASLAHNTRLQPMSPYGWYQLAVAQAQQGDWDAAHATQVHLNAFEPKFARGLQLDLAALKGNNEH